MIIHFMSFNIQHGRNYITRLIDVDLIVKTIKQYQAEIIGLNEVFGANEENTSQAELIANQLGYYYYFAQAIVHQGRPYGNAIISKYPIEHVETIMIPDAIKNDQEFFETRCIIHARFQNPAFSVLVSHFGLAQGEKQNAVKTILNLTKTVKQPLIVMGDFNMEPDDIILQPLLSRLNNSMPNHAFSYPSINPTKKIDYILASKQIKIISAEIPNIVVSDHFPHIATLDI